MAAPVVPTTLAIAVPSARMTALFQGVPPDVAADFDAARDGIEGEQ